MDHRYSTACLLNKGIFKKKNGCEVVQWVRALRRTLFLDFSKLFRDLLKLMGKHAQRAIIVG